jgi:hypothetical protein
MPLGMTAWRVVGETVPIAGFPRLRPRVPDAESLANRFESGVGQPCHVAVRRSTLRARRRRPRSPTQ